MRRRKCVSASRVAPVCGVAFRIGSLSGILGMDVHNRVMCLLVWLVQEVERKVGWLRELWVAPNGFFSFSFLSSEAERADLEIGKSRRSGVVVVNANLSKPRGGQGYAVRCACVAAAAARRHEIGVYCTGWSIRVSVSNATDLKDSFVGTPRR